MYKFLDFAVLNFFGCYAFTHEVVCNPRNDVMVKKFSQNGIRTLALWVKATNPNR